MLSVKTSDSVKAKDKMHTYKRWFNGMKFFYMVRIINGLKNKKLD